MQNVLKEHYSTAHNPNAPRSIAVISIAAVCIIILISTFILYKNSQLRQITSQEQVLNIEVSRIQRAIEVNLQKEAYFLIWLANSLEREEVINDKTWQISTEDIENTSPFLSGVYLLDIHHNLQRTTPESFIPNHNDINWEMSRYNKFSAVPALSNLSISRITVHPDNQLSIEMIHPVSTEGHIEGYLVASYNIKHMVETIAGKYLTSKQTLVIHNDTNTFFGDMPTQQGTLTHSVEILALGDLWQMTVWQYIDVDLSYFSLPMMIFIAGILITALVAISLYLIEINIISRRAETATITMLKDEITQRREIEGQLQFIANHDPQTHLPNRFSMETYLERSIRTDQDVVLMCIYLNKLQEINDMYGHSVADQLLLDAAKRFNTVLPPHAILARVSSDQFMVACSGMSQLEAEMQANHLTVCLEEEFHIEDNDILTSCAVGIAYRYSDDLDAEELLRHADTAAHKAKTMGSRKVIAYNHTMQKQLTRKKELERVIRNAINNDELELHFQPQVDLRTRQIVGIEALVRWKSNNGTVISTDVIIQTAEESGLMQRLGHWVVDTALKQFSHMLDERCAPKSISINISGIEFQDGYIADYVIRSVKRHDIPPSRVQIELTEQVFIENIERNQHVLNRLTTTGISLAIDDFGIGYSSLAYLKHFPGNTVKIDRCFIRDLPQSKDDLVICQAVVSMANLLQLKVVAEGVETREQQELLRNIGCNFAQGYFYYPPMPAEELITILKKQRAERLFPTPG